MLLNSLACACISCRISMAMFALTQHLHAPAPHHVPIIAFLVIVSNEQEDLNRRFRTCECSVSENSRFVLSYPGHELSSQRSIELHTEYILKRTSFPPAPVFGPCKCN